MGRVIAVLRDRLFVLYIYIYYMLVRLLSVCLNHIKGTIIIIIKNAEISEPPTLPNIPKNPARLRDRVDPLDMVLRSESTRMADRDLGLPDDTGGDSPAGPAWLPFMPDDSCSSNGMSAGIRKPDLYFSTVSRESYNTAEISVDENK